MMADESKAQAGQGAAAPDEDNEHSGGERFNRRLLVIAGVFAVVVGVIAGEGIRSAGVKTTSAGTQPPTDNTVDAERHKAEVAELGAGVATPMAMPTPVHTPGPRSILRERVLKEINPAVAADLSPNELQREIEEIIHTIANQERMELTASPISTADPRPWRPNRLVLSSNAKKSVVTTSAFLTPASGWVKIRGGRCAGGRCARLAANRVWATPKDLVFSVEQG